MITSLLSDFVIFTIILLKIVSIESKKVNELVWFSSVTDKMKSCCTSSLDKMN